MRVPCALAFVLVLLVTLPTVAEDKKPDTELKALVGNWKVEKAELGGKDLTEHLKALKFEIFAGGKYLVQVDEEKDAGTFTINPAKKPQEMDVKPTGGPNKGETVKAIYKLEGDTLIVCFDHEAKKGTRPTKFESKPDTTVMLITYKREKK